MYGSQRAAKPAWDLYAEAFEGYPREGDRQAQARASDNAAGEGGGADGDETLQRRAGWSGAATATMHEQWTRLHRPDKYGIDLEVDPYMEYDPEDPPPETAAFLKTLPEVWGKGEGAEVRVYFYYFKCYV